MQTSAVSSGPGAATGKVPVPYFGGHPDYDFAAALD
jgi:hypothetical protein